MSEMDSHQCEKRTDAGQHRMYTYEAENTKFNALKCNLMSMILLHAIRKEIFFFRILSNHFSLFLDIHIAIKSAKLQWIMDN